MQGDFYEYGAQWIHGVEGNVAYDIASSMDLTDPPDDSWPGYQQFYLESGQRVEMEDRLKFWRVWAELLEIADGETVDTGISTGQFYDREVPQITAGDPLVASFMDFGNRFLMVKEPS